MRAIRVEVVVLALVFSGCATSGDPDPEAELLDGEAMALNVDSFDFIWTTLRDRNWDRELGGLDWAAIHDEYRPKVEHARTMKEARKVMTDMLERVEQTHLSLIPRTVYEEIDAASNSEEEVASEPVSGADEPSAAVGTPGVTVRVLDDKRLVVTEISAGSPAALSGVKAGWEITAIDGNRVAPVIREVSDTLGDSTMRQIILTRTFTHRLEGPIDETVRVRFVDGESEEQVVDLARMAFIGNDIVFGNLPVGPVWLKHREVEDDIGYIAFNVFMDPVNLMPGFASAVQSYKNKDGIIIDLRGNRGGIAAMAMGLAGWFVSEPNQYLGTMYMRDAELRVVVNPRLGAYTGPVAILVDGCSASCAEIFAGGLRDLGRARIFGSRTAGAALPAAVERLPNGDGFMYPVANYISRNGDRFEGVGVTPDEEAGYTREALLDGRDRALEAASTWIRNEASKRAVLNVADRDAA